MNLVDCFVKKILRVYSKNIDGTKFTFIEVEYISWGVPSTTALFFTNDEEIPEVKEGYKFQV